MTPGRAAFDWTDCSDPHVRQGSSASSVTSAFGAPAETKKALYVVALSRVRRLRSSLDPVLTPVTGLPSPEPPLAALAKPARNHRHVRNWARTHVLCVVPHCKRFDRPENKKTLSEDNPLLCRANFACGPSAGCSGSASPMHVFHEPRPGRRRRSTRRRRWPVQWSKA